MSNARAADGFGFLPWLRLEHCRRPVPDDDAPLEVSDDEHLARQGRQLATKHSARASQSAFALAVVNVGEK